MASFRSTILVILKEISETCFCCVHLDLMFLNYDVFHKAETCHFNLGPYRYDIIGIIEKGLRFIYNQVQMIFIVKCISMYILFGQECKQSLCGAEGALRSRSKLARASLRSKEVFHILRKME